MSVGGVTNNLAANGQTPERGCIGKIRVKINGDFGTGDAQVQMKDPDGNWMDEAASLSADGSVFINGPDFCQNIVRVDLTGSTNPDLDIWVQSSLDR